MNISLKQTDADLAPVAPSSDASIESVLRYQEALWQRGMRPAVGELLAERPDLREDVQARLELICNEVILREESGESPKLKEYQERFGDLARELAMQWQIDGLLASRRSSRQLRTGPHAPSGGDITSTGRVGRYAIQGVLGKGGMGIAYRAFDEYLKRIVALKMLRAEDADENELARFRLEAEAIARVRHPNIVQVFDVGEHEGRPFFAMEYCAGGSLAERMDGNPLPAMDAARVIEQVACGVAAAHKENIVHRDLKPGNVLLTESSESKSAGSTAALANTKRSSHGSSSPGPVAAQYKVTDFGLAKKLDAEQAQTHTGAVMGTPVYMAPEQAFGETKRVGPAADVYSLGAMLYECLTGRPPFKGATIPDTLDLVRHREPVPVRQLQPRTPLDLETICLKCLSKEPGKRYATAQELADDLGRFLDGRPILARPLGAMGRAWRWCKRNKLVASLLTLVIGVLLAGVVSTSLALWQAWRNEAKAIQKEQESVQALEDEFRAVDMAFTKVSEDKLLEQPGMLELRRELVKASMPFYRDFVAKRRDDPRWRKQLAVASARLGRIHYSLGAYPEAIVSFEEALALNGRLREEHPGETELADHEASMHLNLGHCHLNQGKLDAADAAFARSQTLYAGSKGSENAQAEILHYRATIAQRRGDPAGALKQASEAAALLEKVLKARPSDFVAFELLGTRLTCATCREGMRDVPGALRELQAAHELTGGRVEDRPRLSAAFRQRLAQVRGTQGRLYNQMNRPKEAEPHLRAADEELSRLRQEFPTVAAFSRDWASNRRQVAINRLQSDDPAEAEKLAQEAARELERLRKELPQDWDCFVQLSGLYAEWVRFALAGGKAERALPWNGKRLVLARQWQADHPDDPTAKDELAKSAAGLAQTLTRMGRHVESLEYWDLCLHHGGPPDPLYIKGWRAVARAIAGDWRRAEQDVRDAFAGKARDPAMPFVLGCARAAMAEAVAKDESVSAQEREAKRAEWTAAALGLLAEAKKRGHQKGDFGVAQWKTERALDSLRKLPEFRAMMPE